VSAGQDNVLDKEQCEGKSWLALERANKQLLMVGHLFLGVDYR